jgi:hypothetical protein
MIGERAKTAGESLLLLIFGVRRYLVVSRISIQETVIGMPCQAFHHLIYERKGKMIFPGGGIQFAVVDKHSLS